MSLTRHKPLVAYLHRRSPWRGGERVHVFTRWGSLKGTDESLGGKRAARAADYRKAKQQGDLNAAARIVRECIEGAPSIIDQIVDVAMPTLENGKRLICAVPHPPFDDVEADGADLVGQTQVKNALPLAFRAWMRETLGADHDTKIVQAARVGRTKLRHFPRFLCQPAFVGEVDPEAGYVLADDVFTMGGTLAALRAHILRHGGTVVLATALAHWSGLTQELALVPNTWDQLASLFGGGFGSFWEAEIGHDPRCLTQAEGQFLVRWALEDGGRAGDSLLQRLRDRLTAAAARGE